MAKPKRPSDRTIKKAIKELRALIDSSDDPCEQRIAYAMETALRWATLETVDWTPMAKEAKLLATMLHKDLT